MIYHKDLSLKIDKAKQTSDTVEWVKYRYTPQGGMLKKYKTLFTTLHGNQQKIKFLEAKKFTEIIYDTLNNLYYGRLSNPNVLTPGATIFGWHPYWITEAFKYYPYALLSTIAFFAYDVNENNGAYYDQDAIKTWRSTSLLDSARKYNVNILLTVTSYGRQRNNQFLKNQNAWATLGDSLKSLLLARNAQGVDIDFLGIPKERNPDFLKFINTIRTKLGDTSTITLHLTASDLKRGAFDLRKLKSLVNTFIVQGYDYEENSYSKGALAPLYTKEKEGKGIANTVDFCLHNGLEAKNIVLSLPLYGRAWYRSEPREMPYDDIVSLYEKNYITKVDLWTESATINLRNRNDTIINYENSESLYRKFWWAKAHELQGVGLWGLGYDGGRPEVWNAIAANYGVYPIKIISPIMLDNGKMYTFIEALQKYRKAIGMGLFITVSFFILGLLLSLLDWRVREIFFRNYINRALLASIIIFLFIISVYFLNAENLKSDDGFVPLLIGLALGGTVVYLSTKFYLTYRKKMP